MSTTPSQSEAPRKRAPQPGLIDPDGGFISPKKGITLSVLGPIVWTTTLILYQMVSAVHKFDYGTFCLFVSFLLSGLCSLYIVKSLYKRADPGGKAILWLMTAILIYTSANGIQAGHSALANPDKEKKVTKSDPPMIQASLFGVLDSRPWLPDAYSKAEIRELRSENTLLRSGDGDSAKLRRENQEMAKELELLRNRINAFNKLQQQWRTMEADSDFRHTALTVSNLTQRFDKRFYANFFETPIKDTVP